MKPCYLILCFFLFTSSALCQTVINHEISSTGKIVLDTDIAIAKINSGYTLWLPENQTAKGLVVFLHARRDTLNSNELIDCALEKGLGVLYATTDNQLEFFFEAEKMAEIEGYLQEILSNYSIPKDNLLFCGMSLAGTRALKLPIFAQTSASKHQITPKAIVVCDAPLDMVRFHKEASKAAKLNFQASAANEGKWVSAYLESNLDGTPKDNLTAYINYSPYCYSANGGKNLLSFKNIAIRAYSEPDVDWWMETRRKDYYGMNVIDLAAMINELNILGNKQAELILTQNKGYHPDGKRHPHSWNIVDEEEIIEWFISLK